ncbi:hypothetical protein F5X68DRAFT_227062 [Plectosphaerella plurivora]|uniref:NAD-dependent epimerase/dehydratase domain-containing protein n=1 Tax=Plectosphaerella plurivora TaxID=936078 RepID=A0A9P8VIR8_9PEZI|nr:hypothetical protein F5X68DRAFT_227062 [Plectosphaerella plurivora]
MAIDNPAVPKGSTVLVTGVNGFLGSHVADQYLRQGYKVRGTVRDTEKSAWVQDAFTRLHGAGQFELVAVPAMEADGAFEEVVKGVSIFVHTAAFMIFNNDPEKVIPITVKGAVNAVNAAYAEPSVKRFVLTSSASASLGFLDGPMTVTEETWNDKAVEKAWSGPPYEPYRPIIVYEASNVQSERAVWKFHVDNRASRPDLDVNTIVPNFILGRSIDPVSQGYRTSSGMVRSLWNGEARPILASVKAQYFVNVEDAALLHVAAGVLPRVRGQRVFAFGGKFCWDWILAIMREIEPGRKLPADFSGGEDQTIIEPRAKAEAMLRDLGHPGWTSLADTIAQNVQGP